jgi:dTDP-4-amino-4,6-dideoxygalactose transaminase
LCAALRVAEIDFRDLFYSIPTQTPAYGFLGYKLGDFPEAEYCSDHGVHIGIHQDLSISQLDYVVSVIGDLIADCNGVSQEN